MLYETDSYTLLLFEKNDRQQLLVQIHLEVQN